MPKKATRAGDVVEFDLGEKVADAIRSNGLSGAKKRPGYKPGHSGYRPGMYGRGGGSWGLGAKLGIPEKVNTKEVIGGGLLGVVGNRLVERLAPGVIGTNDKLVVETVAFVTLAIPFAVTAFMKKKSDLTTGIAMPGLFFLGGSLVDVGLDYVGMAPANLQGPRTPRRQVGNARERLDRLQNRTAPAGGSGRSPVATGTVMSV